MSDVYVAFGGDTAGLEAAAARANAAVRAVTREMTALAREMQKTGATADSELGQKLVAAGDKLSEAKAAAAAARQQLQALGETPGPEKAANGITRLGEILRGFVSPLRAVRENLGGIAEAFATAFAIEKIREAVKALVELNDATRKTSLVTGLPLDQVAGLDAAAQSVGASGDAIEHAFSRMGINISERSALAKRALQTLGLSLDELKSKTPAQQFEEIGAAIMRMSDISSRNAVSNALFGRSFEEIAPLVASGKEAIEEWNRVVDETGSSVRRASTSLDQTSAEMLTLRQALRGDGIDLFMEFRGVIDGVYAGLVNLAEAFHNATASGGLLKDTLDAIAGVLKIVESAIVVVIAGLGAMLAAGTDVIDQTGLLWLHLGDLIREVWAGIGAGIGAFFTNLVAAARETVGAIGTEFVDLGSVIGDAFKGDFAGAKAAFGQMKADAGSAALEIGASLKGSISGFDFGDAKGEFEGFLADTRARSADYAAQMRSIVSSTKDVLSTIWGAPPPEQKTPKPTNAAHFAPDDKEATKAARDAMRAAQEEAQGEIKAAQDAFTQKSQLYADEVKTKQLTESQKERLTLAALAQELADEEAALSKEKAIAGTSAADAQRIANQKTQIEQKYAQQVQQIQAQAAERATQAWEKATGEINSAFEGQVDKLLRGQETFAQAFKNVLAALIEDFVKFCLQQTLTWAETQAKNVLQIGTIPVAQAAATAAQTSTIAAGAAAQKAINATTVSGDAGRAAAGAYAAVAGIPIIGPVLAPAAAAVAFGAVEAFGSFAVGSYQVPADMLAMVHKDEMIVPAAPARTWRDSIEAAGGGRASGNGGEERSFHTHLHVHALDSSDVKNFFKRKGRAVAAGLNEAARNGSHLGFAKIGG